MQQVGRDRLALPFIVLIADRTICMETSDAKVADLTQPATRFNPAFHIADDQNVEINNEISKKPIKCRQNH
jgi:hypothetical protein